MSVRVTIKSSGAGLACAEADKHGVRLFNVVVHPTKPLVHADVEDQQLVNLIPWMTDPDSHLLHVVGDNVNIALSAPTRA
jgi:hypothetical protein